MVVLPKSLKRTSGLCNTIRTPGGKETQSSCWEEIVGVGFLSSFFFSENAQHNNVLSSISFLFDNV